MLAFRSRAQQLESRRREEDEQKAADRAFADAWSIRLKELKQEEVHLPADSESALCANGLQLLLFQHQLDARHVAMY